MKEAKEGEKRNSKESEPEKQLLKIACKLEIHLSTFFGSKMHTAVIKLIKETSHITENRLLKPQNLQNRKIVGFLPKFRYSCKLFSMPYVHSNTFLFLPNFHIIEKCCLWPVHNILSNYPWTNLRTVDFDRFIFMKLLSCTQT